VARRVRGLVDPALPGWRSGALGRFPVARWGDCPDANGEDVG